MSHRRLLADEVPRKVEVALSERDARVAPCTMLLLCHIPEVHGHKDGSWLLLAPGMWNLLDVIKGLSFLVKNHRHWE